MEAAEVDLFTRNIARDIIRGCNIKNVPIEEDFCTYFIQLLQLDPKWRLQGNREKVAQFTNYCIDELIKDSPYIVTLKTQHLWMSQPESRKELMAQHRNLIHEKIQNLRNDILFFVIDEQKQTKQLLLRKIIIYIILATGLGSPKKSEILNDATGALGSVFDDEDIFNFCELEPKEKVTELKYITDLVTGIRIFNENTGKTSSGILTFNFHLKEAVKTSYSELQKVLVKIMERVNILTLIIEKSFKMGTNLFGYHVLEPTEEEFDDGFISLLIAFRQQELFIRKLLHEVEEIKRNTAILIDEKFVDTINNLIKIVKYKVAIPAVQVYPLFCELAQIESKIQNEAILLAKYNRILTGLVKLIKEIKFDQDFKKLIHGETILTDASRLEKTNGLEINLESDKCSVIHIDNVDIKSIQLEYLGFCPWCITQTDGGLIPGNPNMGVIKYKNKYFVFSSLEAAEAFCLDPEKYILQIMDLARMKTDLIHFLQLHHKLLSVKDVPTLYQKPLPEILTFDSGIQTDLHPSESKIDPEYRWNVWDMYRDAIRLANIASSKTRLTQTFESQRRASSGIQTVESRSKLMQTKMDNNTNFFM